MKIKDVNLNIDRFGDTEIRAHLLVKMSDDFETVALTSCHVFKNIFGFGSLEIYSWANAKVSEWQSQYIQNRKS